MIPDHDENVANSSPFGLRVFGRVGTGEPGDVFEATAKLVKAPSSSVSSKGDGFASSYEAPEAVKKARQAVAARRPRDKGRFMKSRQKWVTQVELKQTKTTNGQA
eukprot:jgi/Undpi1/12459/HiC_scaffold_5.g02130.m1